MSRTLLQALDLIRFRTQIDVHYLAGDYVHGAPNVYYMHDRLQDMFGQFETRAFWRRFTPNEWEYRGIR